MDNAELLRMVRRLNVDTWLLLLLCCVLALAQIQEIGRRDDDRTFLSDRLARLELWRMSLADAAPQHTEQPAPPAAPAPPRPARKPAAHKAAH